MHDVSLAEMLGFNSAQVWTWFWVLFFLRLILGAFIGIDDIAHGFKALSRDRATHEAEARSIRRGNAVVTAIHIVMLAVFALAYIRLPQ
ncbi:MAG: hypothetical protein KBA31_15315 [Alphaproteobacteria bacterium]|nr:hypothetical protein [Alphaproteobacteria bacterium]